MPLCSGDPGRAGQVFFGGGARLVRNANRSETPYFGCAPSLASITDGVGLVELDLS